jgi:predicted signal transduction protein with EAL and GGDEF domain
MTMTDQETEIRLLRDQNAQLERDVVHLIKHDQLTGLYSRAAFLGQVDRELQARDPLAKPSVMIEFAIGGLPRIAGSLGRHASDYIIAALAARLNHDTEFAGMVAGRLDYSNFAVFVPDVSDGMKALSIAKKTIGMLKSPIDWIDRSITLEATAGVAMSGLDANDGHTLLHNAGLALRQAADRFGPSYRFFNPALAEASRRRLEVTTAIEEAVEQKYLMLQYQPVFSLTTGELTSFEALLRMNHPKLGFISPADFIPIAEDTGLISKIGAWSLAESCKAAVQWPDHITVAVNVSPEQFYNGSLLTDVHHALEMSNFPAYRLEIEITESTMLRDSEIVLSQLNALREMGCAIVLDDFGTGYSSLSYMWKFPFSKLKIDRTFIQAIDSTAIVKQMMLSIIELSRMMGLKVTAEGVETEAQADVVKGFGCDYVQGFLCGKPASERDLAAVILRNFSDRIVKSPPPERVSVERPQSKLPKIAIAF